jgi:hypothetical protein
VVACACLGGLVGVQSCADDGAKYGPCQCPGADVDAGPAQEDAGTVDSGVRVPVDAGPADSDAGLPLGSPCTYPDAFSSAPPTPGHCEGNAAVVCDPLLKVTVKQACAAGETCLLVQVDQPARPTSPPMPHHSYTWASCVPGDAAPCTWIYDEAAGYWVPSQGTYTRCATSHQQSRCVLPLPEPPVVFPSNAGTPNGFWIPHDCQADETCRAQGGGGVCTVGSTACTGYSQSCDADAFVLRCENPGEFPTRAACPADTACRPGCDAWSASCLADAMIADPGLCVLGTPDRCSSDNTARLVCHAEGLPCFERAGQCVCSDYVDQCASPLVCKERTALDGTRFAECAYDVDCVSGSRCDGKLSIRCANDYPSVSDCAQLAMECASGAAGPGCVSGTDACSMVESPGCKDASTVDLCCPIDGVANVGVGAYPCVPGRRFTMACPVSPFAVYQCQSGQCVH